MFMKLMPNARGVAVAIAAFAIAALCTTNGAEAQTVLRATGTGTSAPFHVVDATTGAHSGIMIDLLNAVAADAGFTVEYVAPMQAGDIVPAIAAGTLDLPALNVGITPARAELVNFSVPFFIQREAIIVPTTDTAVYASLADLRGQVVGTLAGSLYVAALQAMTSVFAEVRTFETLPLLYAAVLAGDVKAGIGSSVPIEYALFRGQYAGLKAVTSYPAEVTSALALAVNKTNTELLATINTSLTKLIGDGTIGSIFASYGVTWTRP